MTIKEIISIAENKLATLNSDYATLKNLGDLDGCVALEGEISETEKTLNSLRLI